MSNSILNNAYNQTSFLSFLNQKFLTNGFVVSREILDDEQISGINFFESAQRIGFDETLNLAVIEIQHTSSNDPRIGLTKGIQRLMSFYGYSRALVVFWSSSSNMWRLSLVTQEYELDIKGKVFRKYSNPKRYSFALGQGVQVSTATEFLINKGVVIDFVDLLARFSVEALTKEFYVKIKSEYDLLWNAIKIPNPDNESTRKNFALRLIGRLIFCWFLRAKGWIPEGVLSSALVPVVGDGQDSFYHDTLEALFFDTLNKPASARTSQIKDHLKSVPYLNGGLFEAKTDDYFDDRMKDYDKKVKWQLTVPNGNLKSILGLFEQYHFTIDESTSTDQEIGIDPEMMGRIFENFILDRSATGSFYTPRVIVDYMVSSSLIESLKTQFAILPQTIQQVIEWVNMPTHQLHQIIIQKPKQKVTLNNPKLGRVSISAYLIAKLRGAVFNFRTQKFDDCNAHNETNLEIWQPLLNGNFEIQQSFIPNPNTSNVNDLIFVVPKIGYIVSIDSQTFVLFFTVLFNDKLQLDTFYKIYDNKKITKLCTKNSHKALNILVSYAESKKLQKTDILRLLEVYVPKKNTSELLVLVKIPLMDPSLHILTSLADPGFSALREIYTMILSNNKNIVKCIFGNDPVIECISQILDNSYFSQLDQTKTNILNHLSTLRVLDPACGSGAFPMGVLQKLTEIIHSLDPAQSIYQIKKIILANCIYGVDIMPIAVEISRLRCWLSLVVDQETAPVQACDRLPNLEFKFVCANSLVGLSQPDEGLEVPEIKELKSKLAGIRNLSFLPSHNKQELEKNWKDTVYDLTALQDGQFGDKKHTELLTSWNPFENQSSAFFDPSWMFGVDSFEIVIGNPPYIQLQSMDTATKTLLISQGYKTYQATGDLYQLFYERGVNILKKEGILAYITSNKWMRAGYGQSTRGFFANHTNPLLLLDLGANVFESATVDSNIIIVQNSTNKGQTIAATVSKEQLVNGVTGASIHFGGDKGWFIGSPAEYALKSKIEKNGKPLKDWDIKIYRGVLTGLNQAFIIDSTKRDELLALDPRSAEILKPILRGRDIKRYGYEYNNLYLINSHNGYSDENNDRIPAVNINDYPSLKAHLDEYQPELTKRSDQGITPYNLRNCAYIEEFSKEKVVYSEITQGSSFTFDQNGEYCVSNTGYLITGDNLKYLTALLNSKLINFAYKSFYCTSLGQNGVRWLKQHIDDLPIPALDTPQRQLLASQIESLVEEILRVKTPVSYAATPSSGGILSEAVTFSKGSRQNGLGVCNTADLEHQIDALVYQLYDLTADEVGIVAGD